MQSPTLITPPYPLYEQCSAFDSDCGDMRIFAPIAYPIVRNAQTVPIVHIEAAPVAAWFPVCWQLVDGRPRLVALRTLYQDGSRQPAGSPNQPASLPLALRAYPFVVGCTDVQNLVIDTAIPDQPTDIGSPILTPTGKATLGTQQRVRAQEAFNDALMTTELMTDRLATGDAFEPWPLTLNTEDQDIVIDNLLVVRDPGLISATLFSFLKEFGPVGASLFGAHRISLFRAGVLFQLARAPQVRSNSNEANAQQ